MVYMDKDDYGLMSRTDTITYRDGKFVDINDYYAELDDLIAPAVKILNTKGYKTYFSCSGHPYDEHSLYIMMDGNKTNKLTKAFEKYDTEGLFEVSYYYDPIGNQACGGAKKITSISLSENGMSHVPDYYENYNSYYDTLIDTTNICKTLCDVLSHLPKNK